MSHIPKLSYALGPQSRILRAKACSSVRAPAYIEISAPFPPYLGFNAAIPTASRVAEYPALFPVL